MERSKRIACNALAFIVAGMITVSLGTTCGADKPAVPEVVGKEYLAAFFKGVAAADAGQRPLRIVCMGDSNTEAPTYVGELRRIFWGCYGEKGIGYHTFGGRVTFPPGQGPKIEKKGKWDELAYCPNAAPKPWFAIDGIWTATEDPKARIEVAFDARGSKANMGAIARTYNPQNRVRIHYQKGPGLGAFSVMSGSGELLRVDCAADTPSYGMTEPLLLCDFAIGKITGKVVLLGMDCERSAYFRGKEVSSGGAVLHALGRGWGMAQFAAQVEPESFKAFFGVARPDLVTILYGTNDMHNDGRLHVYRENMAKLIDLIRLGAPECSIAIISCPEAPQTAPGMAESFRKTAGEVAAEKKCAFWDLGAVIGRRSDRWTRMGFFADGLHYNETGGSLWARLFLRQIGFDISDLSHYPSLLHAEAPAGPSSITIPRLATVTVEQVADALKGQEPMVVWCKNVKAAEVRLGVSGENFAVHIRSFDGQIAGPPETWGRDAGTDVYLANPEVVSNNPNLPGPVVHQVKFFPRVDENGVQVKTAAYHVGIPDKPAEFPSKITPAADGPGYGISALIPMSLIKMKPDAKEFRFEVSSMYAPRAGAPASFCRLFQYSADRGAFQDANQSARVTIK